MGLGDRGASKQETGAKTAGAGTGYGIANVLALLRDLPIDANPDLVMRVVRQTLESNHVRVEDLVAEARTCTRKLEQAIASEHASIVELEREIASKNAAVSKLKSDLAEMRQAGERLGGKFPPGGDEWERPSVMTLQDGDIESIPSPQPITPKRT
jgi:septal ring factor EnvC (AmiA/AmiB activator)